MLTALRMTVIEGPDRGKIFLIDSASPQRTLIGTSAACTIRLTDATVSRRHAAIEPLGPRCRINDLGSTNGTFLNGVGVIEALVRGGEQLRCGDTVFRLEAEARNQSTPRAGVSRFGTTIGASEAMRRLYPLCERLAATRIPVLIEGELGTGKELLAESLHDIGPGRGPFVVVDCATLAPDTAELALFGRAAGSSAREGAERAGAFEHAQGGTLFIDEIGSLDPSAQAKLCRALERSEIRPLGRSQPVRVDARVIASTRRDLDREVAAGRFRDELFRRLALARIELPPLRERRGDITLLARHFAESFGAPDALTPDLLGQFEDYPWPGNVRELINAVTVRIALGDVALGEHAELAPRDAAASGSELPSIADMVMSDVPFPIARRRMVQAFEQRYVATILEKHGGNVARASAASGLGMRYFQTLKTRLKRP